MDGSFWRFEAHGNRYCALIVPATFAVWTSALTFAFSLRESEKNSLVLSDPNRRQEQAFPLISNSTQGLSTYLEELDPVRFSEIAGVLLVRSIVPVLEYPEAAASVAIAFWIIECLRRRIMSKSCFAQVVVCIRDVHEIRPFRS